MVNTIFILDEHLKTTKVLAVNGKYTFFDDLYTLDLSTGAESYEFSTNVEDIEESNYIMFRYKNQYKLFQIIEIEQEHSEGKIITTVYGECACLELLNGAVRPFEGEYNTISFFTYILEGTGWSIGNYSTSLATKVVNVKVDKTTQIWSCIQDYMKEFGYELNTRVIYDNGYVKAKLIDIYAEGELGEHTYKRFEYGRNVEGITKKKDLYDFCTALIIDTDQDITNITYNQDGYVKEATSDVILATNENRQYNLGRPYIYGNYEDDSPSGQEAVEKAVEELKRRAVPHFDYECTTACTYEEYEDMSIGDTVYVIDHTFTPIITLEARIGVLEISFTNRNDCKCNLTNYKEIKSKISVEMTGNVRDIVESYFPITSSGIADGAIIDGKIDTVYYQQITADIVSASKVVCEELIAENVTAINGKFENLSATYATIEYLNSNYANIEHLNATYATIENLTANYATITQLNAANGYISTLQSDVANIQTLINGNLTSDNIQSLVLTADKVTIADALIKDAMIYDLSASKINTGILNTNNVVIQSDDGSMLLQGTLQQFKDENGTVRIQIGKDTTGNFTFVLYGEDGTGILLDQDGIKASAVADGLIVDAMVSDEANISGGKLDISSVISHINDNENTLLSSKIRFSDTDQTLDVAFNSLKTRVDTIENVSIDGDLSSIIEQVNTNTTNISIAQGEISTLISNTTITKENGEVVQLKDEFNSTKDTVDSHTQTINYLETNYQSTLKTTTTQYYLSSSLTELAGGSWLDTAPEWAEDKYMWQRMVYTYTDGTIEYGTAVCIAGARGQNGLNGADGKDGTSVNILGSYNSYDELVQAHPDNNNNGDGYIVNGDLYVWDGTQFLNVGQIKGEAGTSMIWKGSFTSHPSDPENGWCYYNSTEGKSFTYLDGTWYQMTVDGTDGQDGTDGLAIVWKGELSTPPSNPETNWVYKDTDNGYVYIYNGIAWELMVLDGSDGIDGANGADGKSVFITYNDSSTEPSAPTGDGTTNGWHTNATITSMWMSQKVANSATEGTWGAPIKIKGEDGTSVKILGTYNTLEELNSAHPSGNENGDGYIIDGDLYVWDGTQFLNVGQIKGTDGVNGNSAYVHIKYSNDGGSTFTDNNGETPGDYMGVYADNTLADSTDPSDYTWTKVLGEKGQSLVKSTPQWYKSTSNTTQTGGSWVETMPTVSDGYYIWLRYKLDWENPTATTYTTPTLEQVAESVKEVSAKQSELQQDLDGFKLTVSSTYQKIDDMNNYSTTEQMNSAIIQKANEITTTVSEVYTTKTNFNNSLKETQTEYYISTSSTELIGGSWSTTTPTPIVGKYIWQRLKYTKNDETITYSDPICVTNDEYTIIVNPETLIIKCDGKGEVV